MRILVLADLHVDEITDPEYLRRLGVAIRDREEDEGQAERDRHQHRGGTERHAAAPGTRARHRCSGAHRARAVGRALYRLR